VTTGRTLAELGRLLGAEVVGDPTLAILGVAPLEEARPDELSFLHNPKYVSVARASRAGAVIVPDPALLPGRNLLVHPHPYLVHARALALFFPEAEPEEGIHPTAVVDATAELAEGVSVGPWTVVGPECRIGSGTVLGAGVVLGRQVEIGDECRLHPHVVVLDRCRIGNRCILQPGVVVGGDGFGYATVNGVHHKVPQVGIAVLEDDVEVGANTCIDRGALRETRIARGTKIDNLVQVAHNVTIGEGSLIVALVGLGGSTRIGEHAVLGGQVGTAGHLTIGDGAIVSGRAGVIKDVPPGAFYGGFPARPHREWLKGLAEQRKIPGLLERVARLEHRLAELEARSDGGDDDKQ